MDKMTIEEAYAGLTENNPHFTKDQSRINHYWKSRGFIEAWESRDAEVSGLKNELDSLQRRFRKNSGEEYLRA